MPQHHSKLKFCIKDHWLQPQMKCDYSGAKYVLKGHLKNVKKCLHNSFLKTLLKYKQEILYSQNRLTNKPKDLLISFFATYCKV